MILQFHNDKNCDNIRVIVRGNKSMCISYNIVIIKDMRRICVIRWDACFFLFWRFDRLPSLTLLFCLRLKWCNISGWNVSRDCRLAADYNDATPLDGMRKFVVVYISITPSREINVIWRHERHFSVVCFKQYQSTRSFAPG